jgi:RsmE family RNA methyltransferase
MNRILFRPEEVARDGLVVLGGRRARHIVDVLHAREGQELRAGVLDGPRGYARVVAIEPGCVRLACAFDAAPPPRAALNLVLALPRPKVLKRLWAPLAMMGVNRVVLVNAEKVERPYFDTHWLLPEHRDPLLIEGLEQAGDTRIPIVDVRRRFKPFVEDELDTCFPSHTRLVAHPAPTPGAACTTSVPAPGPVVIAIGPEGGWTPYELDLLHAHGFHPFSLGTRTLRTDVACIALLAILQFRHDETA